MKIYQGYYESRNFNFEAFSLTKEGAAKAIREALQNHTKQYELEEDWFYEQDIGVVEYKLDTGYRNNLEIRKAYA